jgi:hypothetical protein
MRSKILSCLLVGLGALAGQTVSVNPTTIPGVDFVGSDRPKFNDTLTRVLGLSRSKSENDWLPFSAMLTNNTPLMAVVARWEKVLLDGSTETYTFDRSFFDSPAHRIGLGKTVAVLPYWIFEKPLPAGHVDLTDRPDHAEKVQSFQKASRVRVTLDGIVLASGQFLGPDQSHQFEHLVAIQAARKIHSEVLARRADGQSGADIVAWLRTIASQEQHWDTETGEPVDKKYPGDASLNRNIQAGRGIRDVPIRRDQGRAAGCY